MIVLDLNNFKTYPSEQKEKNVLFSEKGLKVRMIELPPGGEMPRCEMASYVIFYVIEGMVNVTVNDETRALGKGYCLVSEPANLSMRTETGAKVLGTQVEAAPR